MSDSESAHCRLCANLKPHSKLVNLQTDEDRRQKVMEKLIRLSLEAALNCSDDALAKTVCLPCMDSLDTAFEFVIRVEASQSKLNAIVTEHHLKEEVIDYPTYDPFDENYEDTAVKYEFDTSELGLEASENLINESSVIPKEEENCTDKIETLQSWKEYSWLCAYCDTSFPNIDELKEHSMKYHGCCNPYRCTDCNIRRLNLDNFIKHVKRHRQHLKLSCYKCHMTFSRKYDTIKHKKDHFTSEFICTGCNSTFATLKQSKEHSKLYNKNLKIRGIPAEYLTEDFTCVFCPKKFKRKGGLMTHLLIHDADRKRDHTCEKCGKCFLNKSNLAAHMTLHEDSKPYQCEICKHKFTKLSQLRAHIGIHDGKKSFSCEQCGRLFRLKKQLNSHRIIHTDSLPFVCTYCQKRFRFRTILTQHIRQHTGLRPYECQICHRDFTNWSNYNKHMKRKHNMNMSKRKKTPGGFLPINPATGDVELEPEINKNAEWKKKILDNSNHPGRPRGSKNNIGNKKLRKTVSKLTTVND